MSQVTLGVGASHSTLMNTHWAEIEHLREAQELRAGLDRARDAVADAQPDCVVVIGSNHFRGMCLDLRPAFPGGVGEVIGAGEAGTPGGPLPVDLELARALVDRLVQEEFDPAFSLRLTVDHGITHMLQYVLPSLEVPIVPVIINAFAPPLPSLRRCDGLGRVLREVIAHDGEDKRVAVLASGGLSHHLPWPKWSQTVSDDDRFLVEAWLNGRSSWQQYEGRRREIVRSATSNINPEFDRWFLELLEGGDLSELLDWRAEQVEAQAGNGGQEIRAWIAMAAAVGLNSSMSVSTLAYAAIPSLLTGMGVSIVNPDRPLAGQA